MNLKISIDDVFKKYHAITMNTFIAELKKRNVTTLFRQNEQGFIYEVTFIDHFNKTVFNGRDIGKLYSAKALTERFAAKRCGVEALSKPKKEQIISNQQSRAVNTCNHPL